MTKRFKNAYEIWHMGASNPTGVTNALLDAMKEVRGEGGDISQDPAVKLILDHLCFLCNMPQPSFFMESWGSIYSEVGEHLQRGGGESEMKYKQVTADEWADFCSSFRAYATEGREGEDAHPVLYHKLSQGPLVGTVIGVVHYHRDGTKTYEIADMPNDEVQK